jgi:hypothetical protein
MSRPCKLSAAIRTASLYVGATILSGCVYRTEIYAPQPPLAADHVQGEEIFIRRESLKVQVAVQQPQNKTFIDLSMVFTEVDPSTRFESHDFYIEADGRHYTPIAPPDVYTLSSNSRVPASLAIAENEWLVVRFSLRTSELSTFRVHIPPITVGGKAVPELDSLTFSRTKQWRALSPL